LAKNGNTWRPKYFYFSGFRQIQNAETRSSYLNPKQSWFFLGCCR
jgi:hypothetical protein